MNVLIVVKNINQGGVVRAAINYKKCFELIGYNVKLYVIENANKEYIRFYNIKKKDLYNNDELYYDQEYTVKELLKICKYYGIDKELKASKCKKQDILDTIIFFEVLPENSEIVERRHRMWAYITELINDPKMKQFILWN